MQGSPEQPHPESEQERGERLYADLLATESEAHSLFIQLGALMHSAVDKSEIEAMSRRCEEAEQRSRQAFDRWLEYVDDLLNHRA